ncbi:ubiquitin thioesterase Zranb1-like [Etheostoma cragini]|uniref:ubiquitin thioesterase Zranb1-like n=1 Tax=Etheostoma cragini TaxID=417921 RepID=UPI00155ED8A7|nr:ubiquitin thioesterase Zranb1-like [Etheostoma cragini]
MTELVAKWACEYCTYENWPSAIKCTMCRAQRPSGGAIITEEPFKSSPALDASLHQWDPAGLSNSPTQGGSSLLICPDSSARPRVRIADVPETSSKWSCQMCTYLNWPRAIRCTQCLCQRQQQQQHGQHASHQGHHTQHPRSPTESPQTSGSGCRLASPATTTDPCEEYNDRNRLNTHAQHWTCTACTYENWAKTLKCVVCDHPRPNSLLTEPIELASEPPSQQPSLKLNEQDRDNKRGVVGHMVGQGVGSVVSVVGGCSSSQRRSPPTSKRESEVNMDFQRIELASGAGIGSKEELEVDFKKLKQIKNRMRRTDWLFLNACVGVVEGDLSAVEAYKSSGGDIARQLTSDEVRLLNRSSAFDDGFTLVHLAIRFQRQDMLAVLLTELIGRCSVLLSKALFSLFKASSFSKRSNAQLLLPSCLELEEESPIINWSLELGTRLDSRLYALWNRTAGDCLLDSVLQATWGIYDKDSVLRKTLHDSLHDCSHWFYTRWKEWESWYSQSFGLHFSLREEQWQEDWAFILSLASQPGSSLEQTHIFVLAHILRRPIIVYGVKYYKSFRGETLGYTRFQGVYLPLLWEQSFCWKSPIALGYTRGHFSALVAMENDGFDNRGAGANLNTDDDVTVTFLPLVDSERKLLHIHFLSAQEMGNEEQQEKLLREWLDCCVTEGGVLVSLQKSSRRRNHPLVTQMVEKWLDGYRQIRPCASLSDGEEEEDDDDE